VSELPLSVQKSFLRVLEERQFRTVGGKEEIKSDFRLISASNRNLDEMVQNGEFREDLLFRIRSFAVEVPPLRQRKEDIKSLVSFYMPKVCERLGIDIKEISPEFYDALLRYDWPGNVRELLNSLERSIVAGRSEQILLPQHLPTYLRIQLARTSALQRNPDETKLQPDLPENPTPLPTLQTARDIASNNAERQYLETLITVTQGDIKECCRISKLSRSRLYTLLKKHQIQIPR
jgi:two-component system, NtrC family, response regulator